MMDAWTSQGETEVINKPEYHFALEEFRRGKDQMVFLHLTVKKWNTDVAREILRNWKLFRQCVTCPVYAIGGTDDTEKWEKFVSLLGFKPLMPIVCENGAKRRLFMHTNKEKNNERSVATANQRDDGQQLKYERRVSDEPVERSGPLSDAGVPERG
jgi:hypothetical protein